MKQGICKLCLRYNNLEESHLIPAGILRTLRAPELSNPNPITVTNELAIQSSKQVVDYLLCRTCENLFSKNGEDWVTANTARIDQSFALGAAIKESTPIEESQR